MFKTKLVKLTSILFLGLLAGSCNTPANFTLDSLLPGSTSDSSSTDTQSPAGSDADQASNPQLGEEAEASLPPLVGVAFQPYVGAWSGSSTPAWNSYSQAFVTSLLQKVQQSGYSTIRTYGVGTSYWTSRGGTPDSNQYNVPAAAGLGMKVLLGCALIYNGSSLDVTNSQVEINTAIAQAKAHPSTVLGLIISNEAVGTNGVTVSDIVSLMNYAKTQRTAAGFTSSTLPVTVCERWGVLAGSVNKGLSQAAEGIIVANFYPFFDAGTTINTAQTDLQANYNTLRTNLNNWNLNSLQIVIGESGWATAGVNSKNPQGIPSTANQQKYTQIITQWANQNSVPTFIFEAFDEPWKANPATNPNSVESHFGILTTP